MRYVPYGELGDTPNVVVDGSPQHATVLTLSHWPGSPTPDALRHDLSAGSALAYAADPQPAVDADVVSNNHFDEDGLMSVFALVDPSAALARRDRVLEVASVGDFGVGTDRDAIRAAFTIGALAGETPPDGQDHYQWLLPQVPALLDDPDGWRDVWADEDATYQAALDAIGDGRVRIEEHPEIDLAVVRIAEGAPVHDVALHTATRCVRLATMRGRHYEYVDRYETWVRYVSRPVPHRVDLHPLAEALSVGEPGDAHWAAEPASGIVPRLHLVGAGESALEPGEFVAALVSALWNAPEAWDPAA